MPAGRNWHTGCPIKKVTQAFGSCSITRVPILFKLTMDIVWKMAKIIVTKANSLGVLPHLECVWLRRLHFCCFHWTRRSLPKKFSWDHPKTRLDFEKCPEQKDKSLRTPFASNYDRNRLWDVRQGCQPPPFGGPWACPRWSAGSGPTSSAFFKSLLRVTNKMFMLNILFFIHHMFCHLFGNTTMYKCLLSREYFIIYDRKQ